MRIRATAAMAVLASLRIWSIALFLFGTVPAFAANPNTLSESQALQLHQDVSQHIGRTVQNLLDMAQASKGVEAQALVAIANSGTASEATVSRFLELALIYQAMTSEKDKVIVAGYASIDLATAKGSLDVSNHAINQYLTSLTSPASIAEAQRLRDALHELRQELDQYHY